MQNIFENSKIEEMISLIKKYHAPQTRNGGRVPYAQHCVSAAEIVNTALVHTREIDLNNPQYISIICAALGHDLLEDTNITKEELLQKFSLETLSLIEAVTNEGGDDKHEAYAEKLLEGSEEALLVKYGDFIENTISVAYGLPDLGYEWANTFYLPIMLGTEKVLIQRQFIKYPQTAALLHTQYTFSKERFLQNLAKYEPDQNWKE